MADIIWTKVQVVLTDVPIEYMQCNSVVFYGGQEVIVEFTGQSWDNPKVIGFKENPLLCSAMRLLPDGTGFRYSGDEAPIEEQRGVFSFFFNSEVLTLKGTFPTDPTWFACCTGDAGTVYRLGGYELVLSGEFGAKPGYVDDHYQYDVNLETWEKAQSSNIAVCRQRYKYIGNGKAILCGGETSNDPGSDSTIFNPDIFYGDTKRYSFGGDSWTIMASVYARSHPASFVIDGIFYIAGGASGDVSGTTLPGGFNDQTYAFYNDFDAWISKRALPNQFGYACGFGFQEKGYLGGGCAMEFLRAALPNTIEQNDTVVRSWAGWDYDSYSWTWYVYCEDDESFNVQSTLGPLTCEHHPYWIGTPVNDEDVLCFRPIIGDWGGFLNTGVGLYYDPSQDAWSFGTCHPSYSWAYGGFAHSEIEANKGVRVGGGRSGSQSGWILDALTDTWSAGGGVSSIYSKKFGSSGIGVNA